MTEMRKTVVEENGPQPFTVANGEEQHMLFEAEHEGPFWMSPEERLQTRQDKVLGKQTRIKTNLELLINLRSSGYDTTKERFTKVRLTEIAQARDIPLDVTEDNIKEGWLNRPKGMLQVLWEQG